MFGATRRRTHPEDCHARREHRRSARDRHRSRRKTCPLIRSAAPPREGKAAHRASAIAHGEGNAAPSGLNRALASRRIAHEPSRSRRAASGRAPRVRSGAHAESAAASGLPSRARTLPSRARPLPSRARFPSSAARTQGPRALPFRSGAQSVRTSSLAVPVVGPLMSTAARLMRNGVRHEETRALRVARKVDGLTSLRTSSEAMHWRSAVIGSGISFALGCGSRTGLELGTAGPASESDDGGGAPSSLVAPGSIICSNLGGPVPSCIETPESGPVQLCDANFPHCVRPPGFDTWGCCAGNAPYNGSSNCRFSTLYPSCPAFLGQVSSDGGPTTIDECLPGPLPATANEPACSAFVARFPYAAETSPAPSAIADCRSCAEPGLSVPVDDEPGVLRTELSQYGCVCEAEGLRDCDETSDSIASWCYEGPDAGAIMPCPEASLDLHFPAGLVADVYIVCLE
jgi:hypothetical protein